MAKKLTEIEKQIVIEGNYDLIEDIIKADNGVLRITIDYRTALAGGLKKGDKVRAWIRKMPNKKEV